MSGATRVAFLGPEGTFASEAVRKLTLLADIEPVPVAKVTDIVDAVESGEFDYGLVPFENSVEGVVTSMLDRLVFRCERVLALEEVVLPVTFTAYVSPAYADHPGPWTVVSHPHALAQCTGYVERTGEALTATSTAEACALAAAGGRPLVALAGPSAGAAYELNVRETSVEDHPGAATRFLLLGHAVANPTGPSATLLVVTPPVDHSGTLHDLLDVFAKRELDLSALTVRPLRGTLGLYTFVLTVRRHLSDDAMQSAVRELVETGLGVKLLGCYRESGDRVEPAQADRVPTGSVGAGAGSLGVDALLYPPVLGAS